MIGQIVPLPWRSVSYGGEKPRFSERCRVRAYPTSGCDAPFLNRITFEPANLTQLGRRIVVAVTLHNTSAIGADSPVGKCTHGEISRSRSAAGVHLGQFGAPISAPYSYRATNRNGVRALLLSNTSTVSASGIAGLILPHNRS